MQYLEEFATQLCLDKDTLQKVKESLHQFNDKNEKIYVPALVYMFGQTCRIQQVNGQITQGNGITLTQIIRNLDPDLDIEQFLIVLQDLPSQIKLHSTQLENIIRQANFSFRLYKKFDKCFSLIQPMHNPDKTPQFSKEEDQEPYISELKKIAWLLSIIVRQNVLKYEEHQEYDYLLSDSNMKVILILVASLSTIFKYLPLNYTANVPNLHQKMLSFFCSDSMDLTEELSHYEEICQQCITQIILVILHKKQNIDLTQKCEQEDNQFFNEINIDQQYKRLHKYYDTINDKTNLDEECFLRQKIVFTPKKSYQFDHSEFDTLQKKVKINNDPPFLQTPLKQNKFSNNNNQNQNQEKTYFDIKKPIAPQTPVSKCMESHLWIRKVVNGNFNFFNDSEIENTYLITSKQKIKEFLDSIEIQRSTKRTEQENLIQKLSLAVINQLSQSDNFDPLLLNNHNFMFAILALSVYTHQVILQKPNLLIHLSEMCQTFQIQPLDLFRVVSNFASFNKPMPSNVIHQLWELEKYILFNLIWHEQLEYAIEIFSTNSTKYFEQELRKRFFHHLALRANELANQFNLSNLGIDTIVYESINEFMKHPKPEVLRNTSIDTIIVCTFYIIQKHNKQSPSFNAYNKLYSKYYSQQSKVFTHIVEYYNDKYLNAFRDIVKSQLASQQTEQIQIPISFQCQSPLFKQIPISPNRPYRAIQENINSPQQNFMKNILKNIKNPNQPL